MDKVRSDKIHVADIDTEGRLRAVDEAHAQLLAENIRQTGQLRQPIEVRDLGKGRYQLIAGAHRLRAMTILGWELVDAEVWTCTAEEARLLEIDENLVRHDLNPLDRAVFLAERKKLYEALHPDTIKGVAGGKARQGAATDIMSFARDTAERCGITERTVQRAVTIATKLAPDVRQRVAGTWVAKKQSELLALTKLEPAHQRQVLDMLLADEPTAKSVGAATRAVTGARPGAETATQQELTKLMTAWRHAGTGARAAFLDWLKDDGALDGVLSQPTAEAA